MERDKQIFSLIVKNAVYAFLKEKYPNYQVIGDDDVKNIDILTERLSEIEDFAYIPDKHRMVEAEYQQIKEFMINSEFREEKLLESTSIQSQSLTSDEKKKVLNSVIYVMHMDNKISKTEKPIILQVAKFLDMHTDYETIVRDYKNSEFKEPMSTLLLVFIGLLFLSSIVVGLFWKIKQQNSSMNVFKNNELTFNEVYFNKYLIYENKYDVDNDHFKKQAIYYLSGKVDVSVDTDNLSYNQMTKTVTLSVPKPPLFQLEMNFKPILEVDRLDPKPINEEEANNVAAVVGIAGAYSGAKVGAKGGDMLSLVLPPNLKLFSQPIAAGAGAVLGGTGAYFVTSNLLEGMQLSKIITQREKSEVLQTGKELIKAQMSIDEELVNMYKNNFKQYITLQYGKYGKEVKDVLFKAGK